MNILIVNQSVIDACASLFTVLSAVVEVKGTGLSPDNVYDQFICRFWHTRILLWNFLITSSYNIFLMALERYIAVIYPMWYNKNVSIVLVKFDFFTIAVHSALAVFSRNALYKSTFYLLTLLTSQMGSCTGSSVTTRQFSIC